MERTVTMEDGDVFYNNHYIRLDEQNRIVHGFSDAFESPTENDILINAEGSYQFRLVAGGEENPQLCDEYFVPLYIYDNGKIARRSSSDVEADRPEPEPPPVDRVSELEFRIAQLEIEAGRTDFAESLISRGMLPSEQIDELDSLLTEQAVRRSSP